MLEVAVIPAFKDNYIFVIFNNNTREAVVVDPGKASPVMKFLEERDLSLKYILNTHHHWDHTGGNKKLKKLTNCQIVGYKGDASRIDSMDISVQDGQVIDILGTKVEVLFTPGHTLGHICYYFAAQQNLFCGDTLFAVGCGFLFEGSYEQMYNSLQRLGSLPSETKVYCAHEYTLDNCKFALTVDPDNVDLSERFSEVEGLRKQNISTIPTTIAKELATNPFIRAKSVDEFAIIRQRKNSF